MKPGKKLDLLIAEKVMKLQVCKCDHEYLREKHYKTLEKRREIFYENYAYIDYFSHSSNNRCNTCNCLYMPNFNYSTDIKDSWSVVEKLNNYCLKFTREIEYRNDENNPEPIETRKSNTYGVWKYTVTPGVVFTKDEKEYISYDSMSHAICLTALKIQEEIS